MKKDKEHKELSKMLRVDHAGEVSARKIYDGQLLILSGRKEAEEIKHMRDQEQHHLDKFDELLNEYNIRPSLLTPVWNLAGLTLGTVTALMGTKSAMACTIAVEEVIGEHYQKQAIKLKASNKGLSKVLNEFADEELEHRKKAQEHNGEEAFGYRIMKGIIQSGCRGAIKIAEKI